MSKVSTLSLLRWTLFVSFYNRENYSELFSNAEEVGIKCLFTFGMLMGNPSDFVVQVLGNEFILLTTSVE